MWIVAGHIRASQRDHDRGTTKVQERQKRAGRQREENVDRVVRVGTHQPADQGQGRYQVAGGVTHARLVHTGATAFDPKQPQARVLERFMPGLRCATIGSGSRSGSHDIHLHAPFGEPLGERSGSHRSSTTERWILVVQQQDPHHDCSSRSRSALEPQWFRGLRSVVQG
jgi:hypothetical protein